MKKVTIFWSHGILNSCVNGLLLAAVAVLSQQGFSFQVHFTNPDQLRSGILLGDLYDKDLPVSLQVQKISDGSATLTIALIKQDEHLNLPAYPTDWGSNEHRGYDNADPSPTVDGKPLDKNQLELCFTIDFMFIRRSQDRIFGKHWKGSIARSVVELCQRFDEGQQVELIMDYFGVCDEFYPSADHLVGAAFREALHLASFEHTATRYLKKRYYTLKNMEENSVEIETGISVCQLMPYCNYRVKVDPNNSNPRLEPARLQRTANVFQHTHYYREEPANEQQEQWRHDWAPNKKSHDPLNRRIDVEQEDAKPHLLGLYTLECTPFQFCRYQTVDPSVLETFQELAWYSNRYICYRARQLVKPYVSTNSAFDILSFLRDYVGEDAAVWFAACDEITRTQQADESKTKPFLVATARQLRDCGYLDWASGGVKQSTAIKLDKDEEWSVPYLKEHPPA